MIESMCDGGNFLSASPSRKVDRHGIFSGVSPVDVLRIRRDPLPPGHYSDAEKAFEFDTGSTRLPWLRRRASTSGPVLPAMRETIVMAIAKIQEDCMRLNNNGDFHV